MTNPEAPPVEALRSKPVPSATQAARDLVAHMPPEGTCSLALAYTNYAKWALARELPIETPYRWEVELKKAGIEVYIGAERKKMIRKI